MIPPINTTGANQWNNLWYPPLKGDIIKRLYNSGQISLDEMMTLLDVPQTHPSNYQVTFTNPACATATATSKPFDHNDQHNQ